MQTSLANFLLSHDCIIQLFTLGTPNLMLIKSTIKYYSTGACKYEMIYDQQGEYSKVDNLIFCNPK